MPVPDQPKRRVDQQLDLVNWHISRGDGLRANLASRAGTLLSTDALIVDGLVRDARVLGVTGFQMVIIGPQTVIGRPRTGWYAPSPAAGYSSFRWPQARNGDTATPVTTRNR